MISLRDFFEFLDQIGPHSSVPEVGAALHRLGSKQKYERLTIIDGPRQALVFAPRLTPGSFAKTRADGLAQDPRFAWALAHKTPETHTAIREHLSLDLPTWQQHIPADEAGFDGFVVPVHREGTLSWCVEYSGAAPQESSLANALLHTAAVVAHDHVRMIEAAGPAARQLMLTPQQSACLHWVQLGKTDQEIAAIMGISARTVRYHLALVREKFGVKTRVQAAVAAMRRPSSDADAIAPPMKRAVNEG